LPFSIFGISVSYVFPSVLLSAPFVTTVSDFPLSSRKLSYWQFCQNLSKFRFYFFCGSRLFLSGEGKKIAHLGFFATPRVDQHQLASPSRDRRQLASSESKRILYTSIMSKMCTNKNEGYEKKFTAVSWFTLRIKKIRDGHDVEDTRSLQKRCKRERLGWTPLSDRALSETLGFEN